MVRFENSARLKQAKPIMALRDVAQRLHAPVFGRLLELRFWLAQDKFHFDIGSAHVNRERSFTASVDKRVREQLAERGT